MENVAVGSLEANVAAQIDDLPLQQGRPLLVTDVDDVIVHFTRGFELFLATRGLHFTWERYSLIDCIRANGTLDTVPADEVARLLGEFIVTGLEHLDQVEGAAEALSRLYVQQNMQVVVLSSSPHAQRAERLANLESHGMDYPLVVGASDKGTVLQVLAERVSAPIVFVDDLPRHHVAVRNAAPRVARVHVVADRRLRSLFGDITMCDHVAESWEDAERAIASFAISSSRS
jgi:hypothetical protein